jgi:hypothetical protein
MVWNLDAVRAIELRQEAAMHKEGDHIVETPVESRQGFLDRPVLVVLVVSCVLAVVVMAAAYAGFFGKA